MLTYKCGVAPFYYSFIVDFADFPDFSLFLFSAVVIFFLLLFFAKVLIKFPWINLFFYNSIYFIFD